jgi:ADP-ribose pyrophosphatase
MSCERDPTGPAEVVWEGKWLRMLRRGSWEYVERTNAGGISVIIVATTPQDTLLFVEQTRVPLQCKTIEMPAGLVGDIDSEESLELAAQRELLEETGWRAGRMEYLMTGPSSAGMSTELMAFVRARDLVREHAGGGDETEDILVHEIPAKEAARWLVQQMAEGYSIDAKVWAGLYFAERNPDGTLS